jgi:hypothetical protein
MFSEHSIGLSHERSPFGYSTFCNRHELLFRSAFATPPKVIGEQIRIYGARSKIKRDRTWHPTLWRM